MARLPELELQTVRATHQANHENYVVDKNGDAIWSTGEAILVDGVGGSKYIVKDIVNLQSKRQLQLILTETEELLEGIFETSKGVPMMVLDGGMKILKVNGAFQQLFQLKATPPSLSRLAALGHPFWSSDDMKAELANILVTNTPIKNKKYLLQEKEGQLKPILINTKILEGNADKGRRIFVLVTELPQ